MHRHKHAPRHPSFSSRLWDAIVIAGKHQAARALSRDIR